MCETRNYLIEEINRNKLMSKKDKKMAWDNIKQH